MQSYVACDIWHMTYDICKICNFWFSLSFFFSLSLLLLPFTFTTLLLILMLMCWLLMYHYQFIILFLFFFWKILIIWIIWYWYMVHDTWYMIHTVYILHILLCADRSFPCQCNSDAKLRLRQQSRSRHVGIKKIFIDDFDER